MFFELIYVYLTSICFTCMIEFCQMEVPAAKRSSSPYDDEFPSTLEGFGYYFNNAGQLRDINSDIPFRYEVKQGNNAYNQRHYEALGVAVEDYVYNFLEEREELEKVIVPLDAVGKEPRSFIFKSKDMETKEKLLILINGSGVVRAGQWSRSLIINHSLESGSQLQYIQQAKEEGYGIVVMNTNQHVDAVTGKGLVRGSESPGDHFLYVWDKVVMPAAAKHIAIMAHSYGGVVVVDGLKQRPGEIMDRVFAVAMSDSVHPVGMLGKLRRIASDWFIKNGRNWVSSDLPLNTRIDSSSQADCKRVSAGTKKHVETSWYAFKSVFKFLEKRLKERLENEASEEAATADQVDAALEPEDKLAEETACQVEKVENVGATNMDIPDKNESDKKLPIEHEESEEPEMSQMDTSLAKASDSMPEVTKQEIEEKMEL